MDNQKSRLQSRDPFKLLGYVASVTAILGWLAVVIGIANLIIGISNANGQQSIGLILIPEGIGAVLGAEL